MKIGSPRQLKDWINNLAKENNLIAAKRGESEPPARRLRAMSARL
jgi:hypothetical protein